MAALGIGLIGFTPIAKARVTQINITDTEAPTFEGGPAQLRLSDNDFLDPRNRHRHHLSATLLDGRAGNGWARLLRCSGDRSGGGFPNAGYEPHPSCGDCPLTARSRPKRAAEISRKIVAGQQ
jgi:hypothetical protein